MEQIFTTPKRLRATAIARNTNHFWGAVIEKKPEDEPIPIIEIFEQQGFASALAALGAVEGHDQKILRLAADFANRLRPWLPEKIMGVPSIPVGGFLTIDNWYYFYSFVDHYADGRTTQEQRDAVFDTLCKLTAAGGGHPELDYGMPIKWILSEPTTPDIAYRVSSVILNFFLPADRPGVYKIEEDFFKAKKLISEEKKAQERLLVKMLTGTTEWVSKREKRSTSIREWSKSSPDPAWNW
jgi:hypothetical protein